MTTTTIERRPPGTIWRTCFKCRGTKGYYSATGRRLGHCYNCGGNGGLWVPVADTAPAAPQVAMPPSPPAAPAVETSALLESFRRAKAAGIQRPRIRMDSVTITMAGAASANAGGLYVKDDAGTYLGKVMGGRFMKSRECSAEQETTVVDLLRNPTESARAYGKRTGICCICSRELTDNESIDRGIGPVCAEKWGM